jgi:hypothetical protein
MNILLKPKTPFMLTLQNARKTSDLCLARESLPIPDVYESNSEVAWREWDISVNQLTYVDLEPKFDRQLIYSSVANIGQRASLINS